MNTVTCRVCPASIVWAVTVNGRPMPIDATPDDRGNVRLTERRTGDGAPLAEILGPLEVAIETAPLHMPHHATCPNWHHRGGTR